MLARNEGACLGTKLGDTFIHGLIKCGDALDPTLSSAGPTVVSPYGTVSWTDDYDLYYLTYTENNVLQSMAR